MLYHPVISPSNFTQKLIIQAQSGGQLAEGFEGGRALLPWQSLGLEDDIVSTKNG